MRHRLPLSLLALVVLSLSLHAQPSVLPDGVRFVYDNPAAQTVHLVGDFNGWSAIATPMKQTGSGQWNATVPLLPGTYQYAFLVDRQRIVTDVANPLTFEAVDGSGTRSMLTLLPSNKLVTEGYPVRRMLNDQYPKTAGTVYLNLIFKHHVPMYYDAKKDMIDAPFVRMHATRDYFEMADVLVRYPNVHVTAALSPTLLWQVQEIYVKRMEPFIKESKNPRKLAKIDANGFLARMKGKTDPWIDICLTPAERLTEQDKAYLYKNPWNAFTISAVRMNRFPELVRLYEKWRDARGNPAYTVQELRTLKFFGIFAHFDTEFFERNVPLLQSGTRIKRALDLRDLISYRSDGKYYLKHDVTEEDCQRIVASAYCIMASILPAFDKVKYSPVSRMGQMELAVTSYSDAVLPLLINSDIARQADPSVDLPPAYKHPADADAQLRMAIAANQRYFNVTPTGYIPPYGAMSADVVPLLKKYNLSWFASDQAVLARSEPAGASALAPQKVTVGDASAFGVFSHTLLSNRINWTYRNYYAENSADDFVQTLLTFAPQNGKDDVMITVVIDNDDAWQGYERDTDGKGFVNSLYRKLDALYPQRNLISATLTEYIAGNRDRGIPPHAPDGFPALTALGAGSRFDGDFRMWIGGVQTNAAWTQLGAIRAALPDPPDVIPAPEYYDILLSDPLAIFYGATSEHWFQTFSAASVLYSDPKPYETAFHAPLANALDKAGASPVELASFVPENSATPVWEKAKKLVHCTFRVKLVDREAITHVYIAGSRKNLGNLEPNTVPMWDNGENGDEVFGNNVWTIVTDIEEGDLLYKYSNSGGQGTWEGSEAFPDVWRKVRIEGEKMEFDDIFTKLKK